MRSNFLLLLFCLLPLIQIPLISEPVIPAQEWMSRVDRTMELPQGLITGRLSVSNRKGATTYRDFTLYKKKSDLLYLFSTQRRGLELKILCKDEGDVIWAWDVLRSTLFRKRDAEKLETVLGSGFAFTDLSGLSLAAAYDPGDLKDIASGGGKVLRMRSAEESHYGEIVAQITKDKPVRMDFYGKDKVLKKTLKLAYGDPLYNPRERKRENVAFPIRYDMLDLETGTVSRMEFFSIDHQVSPDDSLFNPNFLNR